MDEITMKDLFQAIHDLSNDMKEIKVDVKNLKSEVNNIKLELKEIRTEMKETKDELKLDIRKVDKKYSIVLEDLLEAKTDIMLLQRGIN